MDGGSQRGTQTLPKAEECPAHSTGRKGCVSPRMELQQLCGHHFSHSQVWQEQWPPRAGESFLSCSRHAVVPKPELPSVKICCPKGHPVTQTHPDFDFRDTFTRLKTTASFPEYEEMGELRRDRQHQR